MYEQSQMHNFDSLPRCGDGFSATQMSEDMFAATQDGGLGEYSPLKQRFVMVPESTMPADQDVDKNEVQASPLVRKGRLRRKADVVAAASATATATAYETQPTTPAQEDPFGFGTTSAFEEMQKAARRQVKKLARMKRAKRRAHDMVHEQAEESEDEYAGLGGVDGEASSEDEDAASVKDMIDDDAAAPTAEEEAKLAALFAWSLSGVMVNPIVKLIS